MRRKTMYFESRRNELISLRKELAATENQFMINLLKPRIAELEQIVRYDVWFMPTALATDSVPLVTTEINLSEEEADEFIYMEHADEPAPDRSDYWSFIKVPTGTVPKCQ
jgi:hypothetical protein